MIKIVKRDEWEESFYAHVMLRSSNLKFILAFMDNLTIPKVLRDFENRQHGGVNILCLDIDEFSDLARHFGVSDRKLPMCVEVSGGVVTRAYMADEINNHIAIGARDLPTLESTYTEVRRGINEYIE